MSKPILMDRDAVYHAPMSGLVTRMEPYNLDDYGVQILPGQRCKVTVGDAEPVIFDRHQLQMILDFMDGEAA